MVGLRLVVVLEFLDGLDNAYRLVDDLPVHAANETDPVTGGNVANEIGDKLSLSGDTSYDIPQESRDALAGPDLVLADAIVPASLCEKYPHGGSDHDEHDVPRTFGTKHVTKEGAL